MSDPPFTEDSAHMSDKSALDLALKNQSVIECSKRKDQIEMARSTEMETQQEETCFMLSLELILNYLSEIITPLLLSTQTFFEDCNYFFKRCTFPDLQEFCGVMKRIGYMFVILGALSYVIPLAYIVIKDILRT